MSFENKINKKTYSFFEWLYRLIIINLITLLLCLLIFPLLPSIVSATSTIKDTIKGNEGDVLKLYFRNFKKYMEKAILIWLILLFVFLIGAFSAWFYIDKIGGKNIFTEFGFWVMVFILLMLILLTLHLPQIIITFPNFSVSETFKIAFFITFKYILSTLILLGTFILTLVMIPFIPISSLIGISFPIYLGIRGTKSLYEYLEQIDFEKIKQEVDDDDE